MLLSCSLSSKYLGVITADQLKWSIHIESVEQKLQRLIGNLYKIRCKLPDWCLRNIYTVFRKKHPLTFSVIFPWKMFRFTQNFQDVFTTLRLITYSADIKIKYSLLPVT